MKARLKQGLKRCIQQAGIAAGVTGLSFSAAGAQEKPAPARTVPASAEVAGKVVTPDGKPVTNAAVFWIERSAEGGTQRRFTADTDAQGQFRFPAAPPPDAMRSVSLLAQTPNWGLSFQSLPHGPRSEPVTLTLWPATTLRVTFTDPNGKPLPNLHPRINMLFDPRHSFLEIPADMYGRWEQTTDTKGEAVFPGLPQGMQVRFAVQEETFATLSYQDGVTLDSTAVPQTATVRLFPGGTVQGRVTWEDGRPAAGIRVGAQAAGLGEGWGNAITDANGRYRMARLRSGAYNIALFLKGDLEKNATARALEAVEVKPGATLDHQDLTLIKGSLVTGKVTDKSSGKPLAGVMIGIYGPAHPQSGAAVQGTTTGPDGVYQLRVPAGPQYVYVMGVPSNRYERPKEGAQVTVSEDKSLTQDFTLVPSAAADFKPITGHVIGPDGKPVARAQITVKTVSTDPAGGDSGHVIEADSSGAFTLQPTTASVRLRARSGSLATIKTALAQSGEAVTLQLRPDALVTLSGQVVDESGKPIPDARVTLVEWWLDTGLGDVQTKTDAQGRFSFPALFSDARYSVSAEMSGYGQQGSQAREYEPGEKVTLDVLRLPRADGVVAGRVVDENGDPVAKQAIMLEGRASAPQEVFTDAQGRFRFEGVVKEPVVLYLHDGSGFAPNPKRANAGDTDVIIVRKSPQSKADTEAGQDNAARQLRNALLLQPGPALNAAAWLNTAAPMPDGLKGKIVLIDFWAVSCGPCVASLPAVQKVSEQFAGRDVVVVGLHASGIEKAALRDFVKAHGLTYPIAIDNDDPQHQTFGTIMRSYGVMGIPTVAVLDRKGVVRYLDFGLEGAVGIVGNLLAGEK